MIYLFEILWWNFFNKPIILQAKLNSTLFLSFPLLIDVQPHNVWHAITPPIIKEITIASKIGGADVESNPRLRLAIQNAKGANMPKDNIERAIKKATSNHSGNIFEIQFEGYGPYGIAVFIYGAADNKNRIVSNIRAIFTKYGGSLGTKGSLDFIFNTTGIFQLERENIIQNIV